MSGWPGGKMVSRWPGVRVSGWPGVQVFLLPGGAAALLGGGGAGGQGEVRRGVGAPNLEER